jgi:adenylate kinase
MNKIYFISGVCGVGKSTIIPYLKSLLSQSRYSVFDFDERGVPENADRDWRMSETKHWIEEGNRLTQENKCAVICGFIKPDDLPNLTDKESAEIRLILLDAESEIIRQRLIKRYTKNNVFDESQKVIGKPVNEFIDNNVYFSAKMKDIFKKHDCPIVDTSNLTPEEAAKKVVDIIRTTD